MAPGASLADGLSEERVVQNTATDDSSLSFSRAIVHIPDVFSMLTTSSSSSGVLFSLESVNEAVLTVKG